MTLLELFVQKVHSAEDDFTISYNGRKFYYFQQKKGSVRFIYGTNGYIDDTSITFEDVFLWAICDKKDTVYIVDEYHLCLMDGWLPPNVVILKNYALDESKRYI